MLVEYDKLVRDNIPEIISRSGKKAEIEVIDGKNKLKYLNKKLKEEIYEYLEDESIEELADIQEVIYEILKLKKLNKEDLEKIRKEKKYRIGGFSKGIILKKVIE